MKIHVGLFKCFEQTYASIFLMKTHIMRIQCHFDATILIYLHFAVFLKTIHSEEVYHRNLCKAENGDIRRGAEISYSSLFFCQMKSTERYTNVSRTLAYTWHDRFSNGRTVGRPKYENCRILKSAPDVIDCF